jgi:CRP-like cAMP-binding protein
LFYQTLERRESQYSGESLSFYFIILGEIRMQTRKKGIVGYAMGGDFIGEEVLDDD